MTSTATVAPAATGSLRPQPAGQPVPTAQPDVCRGTRFAEQVDATEIEVTVPEQSRIRAAGVDLTDVQRIGLSRVRYGSRLMRRLCGEAERRALSSYSDALVPFGLALAFGLKESVIKAAGGFPPGGRFVDIDTSALLNSARQAAPVGSTVGGVFGPVVVDGATRRRLAPSGRPTTLVGGAHRVQPLLLACWVLDLEAQR
jgi:phosphopantetheinyl transferase (holo-ACP synthase)